MPIAKTNGIEIYYEVSGNPEGPPLVLVMGLSYQLTSWDQGLLTLLEGAGFRVVRFDNRDCGLSSSMDELGMPDLGGAMAGLPGASPYKLEDMAADVVGLMDALGIESTHLMGMSMGGMISQSLSINYPGRVRSLCSCLSTTGNREVGQPSPEAVQAMFTPPPGDREGNIDWMLNTRRVISSPGFPFDEESARKTCEVEYDRNFNPIGTVRQLAAIMCSPDRTEGLRGLTIPALVIHGTDDPLVGRSGGEATAAAIPGADLMMVEGMGHDFPEPLWPKFVEAIVANTEKA